MSQSKWKIKLNSYHGQPGHIWVSSVLLLLYLLAALVVYIAAPILAVNWFNQPFMGGFVEQTLVFSGADATNTDPVFRAEVLEQPFGSQLMTVDGEQVRNGRQLNAILKQHEVGDTLDLSIQMANGELKQVPVKLTAFETPDRLAYFIFPYLVGAVYLVAAVWIFIIRRQEAGGRAFSSFAASVSVATACFFDLSTTHVFSWLWVLGLALAGAGLFNLAMMFPSLARIYRDRPSLRSLPYGIGLILAAASWAVMYNLNAPTLYAWAWRIIYFFAAVCALAAFARMIWRGRRTTSPIEGEQIRLITVGSLVSFGPVVAWLLAAPLLQSRWPFNTYLILPLAIFPVAMGYAIQRYRAMRADFIFSRVVLYGVIGVLIVGGYALLLSGLSLILGPVFTKNSTLFSGILFFVLALLLLPLRNVLSRYADALIFRGEKVYQERMDAFNTELTDLVDLDEIVQRLRKVVEYSIQPIPFHIFLIDPLSDQYLASLDEQNKTTTDLHFAASSPLVQAFGGRRNGSLFFANPGEFPQNLQNESSRLTLLAAQVFVPLPGRQRLAGWMALGARRSGSPYTGYDLNFLESVANQAAQAIERAQVVENVQRRVRQMNVLTRVAQGTNITITLDDIYELVYAQSTQVMESDNVRLMLLDQDTEALKQVFYIEADERLSEQENINILPGTALEHDVIRTRRAILTEDYNRECQKRGILTTVSELYAWMCVPLNAGAGTIGALSLGSRDAGVRYTTEQLNLLQAMADQVAGAIVKTRLLDETERRARQLTTLNEVARQLTSTLELEPLLQNILHNAVNILNCEAGSLIMVDEHTRELVFRVTEGPVADSLINKRMPAGSGIVGRAVHTGEPVVINDVSDTPEWFSNNDQQTGFVTRTLLVVPLSFKETVMGVIEVINRRDGRPFSQEDQDLLMAFASQAAIAIENARLYTLTDKALTDRVEELSVMQRIDRELNTSLDTTRTMRITLEWAMRQSGATAGWVGILRPEGVQIMASQGYGDEMVPFQEDFLVLENYGLEETAQSGQPVRCRVSEDHPALLGEAKSQIILPIRRESETSGLILLESTWPELASDDVINFLVRLCDHASIAISNAQLYAAVEAANVAKSEFVSFVAHELKNPMTSIKGYTELLAAGAVGPISETQANFLGTIRSNVDRMKTIVEDLNDMSKIEASRMKLDYKAASLAEMVEETIRSLRKQIEDKEQKLNINIPEDLPKLWCDRNRVMQVLVNLVSNAYKYTDRGGNIYVSAEKCQNAWDTQGAREVVHIWVQDSGIGISPEDQKKIFSKFFRSEDPKTREAPGTGLGLNITRSLVEMQGGKIWFESTFRVGTTFHFTVPIAE